MVRRYDRLLLRSSGWAEGARTLGRSNSVVLHQNWCPNLLDIQMDFCPHLQLAWHPISLHMPRYDQVDIAVAVSTPHVQPPLIGRHVHDIWSYPTGWNEVCRADFSFNPSYTYEGTTFRRVSQSLMLQRQRDRSSDDLAPRIFQYEIVLPDSIVTVVCVESPEVSVRRYIDSAPLVPTP